LVPVVEPGSHVRQKLLRLRDRRLLLTFTVRDLKPPLGVRAIPGVETDDGFEFDFVCDRVMLDRKTGSRYQGGGFGPTVQLDDGTLATSCSYRGEDDKTHLEVIRWKLPTERRPASSKKDGGEAAEAGSGIVLEVVGGKRASCDGATASRTP
jgi:hypothetical protein